MTGSGAGGFGPRLCKICKISYSPGSPNQRVCSSCKAQEASTKSKKKSLQASSSPQQSTPTGGQKRGNDSLSPPFTGDEKKTKHAPLSPESILHAVSAIIEHPTRQSEISAANVDLELIKSLDKDQTFAIIVDLKQALTEQIKISSELSSKCSTLSKDITDLKLALADKFLTSYRSKAAPAPNRTYAEIARMVNPVASRAAIVATISPTAPSQNLDPAAIDSLLGSLCSDGPIAQTISQSKDRIVITFNDTSQRDKAKMILESNPDCKPIFQSLQAKSSLYPAVMLNVPLEEPDRIKADIIKRNPCIAEDLVSVHFIQRNSDPGLGHVKLLFSSQLAMASSLDRGCIFYRYRVHKLVEPNWNREVRRCYKCNLYGHTIANCRSQTDRCGKCAAAHQTRSCTASADSFRCTNCAGSHQSGDPACPSQIEAVRRYKSFLGL